MGGVSLKGTDATGRKWGGGSFHYAACISALAACLILGSRAAALPKAIDEVAETATITAGCEYTRVTSFTVDGWMTAHILKVDLWDPNVAVNVLTSKDALGRLSAVSELVASGGAVAGVNASFFSWAAEPGYGLPIGALMDGGGVITMNPYGNGSSGAGRVSTLSFDAGGVPSYSVFAGTASVLVGGRHSLDIAQYNRAFTGQNNITLYDRGWGGHSPGNGGGHGKVIEAVVSGGRVVELRRDMPGARIPPDGFVLTTGGAGVALLERYVSLGDAATLSVDAGGSWTAVTGGTMLVSGGRALTAFTHIPEGGTSTRQPRTAAGTSADGRYLYLVAVDGRSASSIGMTLPELAAFMASVGCHEALNLDGGGSTTMVARMGGDLRPSVANAPSEGAQRKVISAVGISSKYGGVKGRLARLTVTAEGPRLFPGSSAAVVVRALDEYGNPYALSEAEASAAVWDVGGLVMEGPAVGLGDRVGGGHYGYAYRVAAPAGLRPGEERVAVSLGGAVGEAFLEVLGEPVRISIDGGDVKVALYGEAKLNVTGTDPGGREAPLPAGSVRWAVEGGIGEVLGGTFIGTFQGVGYLEARYGGLADYRVAKVSHDTYAELDSMAEIRGGMSAYPADAGGSGGGPQGPASVTSTLAPGKVIEGSASISDEVRRNGRPTLALSFSFPEHGSGRAVYYTYGEGGLALPHGADRLGIWVYSDGDAASWLAATVTDADGKTHSAYFTMGMGLRGWTYLTADISAVGSPVSVSRVYVACVGQAPDAGTVYLSGLGAHGSEYGDFIGELPMPVAAADPSSGRPAYAEGPGNYRFAVLGRDGPESDGMESAKEMGLLGKFNANVNAYLDMAFVVGGGRQGFISGIDKDVMATTGGYAHMERDGALFVRLDSSKGGLRASGPGQWEWLLERLGKADVDAVFIFMETGPDGFADKAEGRLLKRVLSERAREGALVWVFFKAEEASAHDEDWVKYVGVPEAIDRASPSGYRFIVVSCVGGEYTYFTTAKK